MSKGRIVYAVCPNDQRVWGCYDGRTYQFCSVCPEKCAYQFIIADPRVIIPKDTLGIPCPFCQEVEEELASIWLDQERSDGCRDGGIRRFCRSCMEGEENDFCDCL